MNSLLGLLPNYLEIQSVLLFYSAAMPHIFIIISGRFGEKTGNSLREELDKMESISHVKKMENKIIIENVRFLYDYLIHDFKMEKLNEGIINLSRIDMWLIVIL